jgi:hypothetical protein
MIIGDIITEIVCTLHELQAERKWRRGRAAPRKRATREKGWDDLFDHMSKSPVRTAPGVASQPVSSMAREAALEAKRDGPVVQRQEGSVEALGVLPLARPARKGEV